MKHIAAVAALLFACSSLCADSLLTGVHSVYIAVNNLAVKHDITRALRSELPQVRVVSRASDADVVIELSGVPARTVRTTPSHVMVQQPYISRAGGPGGVQQNVTTVTIPNPEASLPTHTIGSMTGSVRKGNEIVVLHDALANPFFATQFAARFVQSWRDANR